MCAVQFYAYDFIHHWSKYQSRENVRECPSAHQEGNMLVGNIILFREVENTLQS